MCNGLRCGVKRDREGASDILAIHARDVSVSVTGPFMLESCRVLVYCQHPTRRSSRWNHLFLPDQNRLVPQQALSHIRERGEKNLHDKKIVVKLLT